MEPVKWIMDKSIMYKPVLIPCISEMIRYHAIGKKLSFELSWHKAKKSIELLIEQKGDHGGWNIVYPDAILKSNTSIENNRIYFEHSFEHTDKSAWMKAVEYIQEVYGFTPILKGVNDCEHF